jgi:hypothetical protein
MVINSGSSMQSISAIRAVEWIFAPNAFKNILSHCVPPRNEQKNSLKSFISVTLKHDSRDESSFGE